MGTSTLVLVDAKKRIIKNLCTGNEVTITKNVIIGVLKEGETKIEGILALCDPDKKKPEFKLRDGYFSKKCKLCGKDFEPEKNTNFCCLEHKRKYRKQQKEEK
jgi:hypothetical protein